jgi:hypothetical protein
MSTVKLVKGDDVKMVRSTSGLLPKLLASGWVAESATQVVAAEVPAPTVDNSALFGDVAVLRARATELNIKFHPASGAAKLAGLIADAEAKLVAPAAE